MLFLELTTLFTLALGASAAHGTFKNRANHDSLAKRVSPQDTNHTIHLDKRFDNSRWSWYDAETGQAGACGRFIKNSDFAVALNTPQYGGGYPGPQCFKTITLSFGGKTAQAQILDQCPGCPYGGLDLTPALFAFFAPQSVGIIHGSWDFGSGGGGGGAPPPPAPAPAPAKPAPPPRPSTTPRPSPTPQPAPPPKPSSTPKPAPTPRPSPPPRPSPTPSPQRPAPGPTTRRSSKAPTPSTPPVPIPTLVVPPPPKNVDEDTSSSSSSQTSVESATSTSSVPNAEPSEGAVVVNAGTVPDADSGNPCNEALVRLGNLVASVLDANVAKEST